VVCTSNLSFICAFIVVFVVASMAHLYSQQLKHFENHEYGGICTCGYSFLYDFHNLVLLMPLLFQILCTFEFTYSYTSIFVVFIGNNTNICTILSSLRRMLQCGCGQPAFCTNASNILWLLKPILFLPMHMNFHEWLLFFQMQQCPSLIILPSFSNKPYPQ
jgi:hypothetical protein